MKIGYFLGSEEWGPHELVEQAKQAEQAGFEGLWISDQVRLEMLEEAIEVIRTLWRGGAQNHFGKHYRLEHARIYDPETLPPIVVSGFGERAVALAARIGDGYCTVGLAQVLPTPEHFEQACELVTEELIAEPVTCGPDIERHVEAIRADAEAGFDELYVNQIGPDQAAFFAAYGDQVLPSR